MDSTETVTVSSCLSADSSRISWLTTPSTIRSSRLYYLVMVVKARTTPQVPPRPLATEGRSVPRLLRGHNPAAFETDEC
jgi:hypothetical protein